MRLLYKYMTEYEAYWRKQEAIPHVCTAGYTKKQQAECSKKLWCHPFCVNFMKIEPVSKTQPQYELFEVIE